MRSGTALQSQDVESRGTTQRGSTTPHTRRLRRPSEPDRCIDLRPTGGGVTAAVTVIATAIATAIAIAIAVAVAVAIAIAIATATATATATADSDDNGLSSEVSTRTLRDGVEAD